jgi:hypothetical protein
MSSSAVTGYTVTGELLVVGKKNIICRCPRTLRRLIEADISYAPVADYRSVVKDEKDKSNTITLFDIRLKDRLYSTVAGELPKTYEVVFELPISFNDRVVEGQYGPEISLEGADTSSFYEELRDVLKCWSGVMKQKLSAENVEFHSPLTWKLKWPWKKMNFQQYMEQFNPETDRHKITMGLGYHNLKDAKMGISLQLSQYASSPPKNTKKRKQEEITPEEVDPAACSRGLAMEQPMTESEGCGV